MNADYFSTLKPDSKLAMSTSAPILLASYLHAMVACHREGFLIYVLERPVDLIELLDFSIN